MAHPAPKQPASASQQLEELLGEAWPFRGAKPKYDVASWEVIDDWPNPMPISETELDILDGWFGDLVDELLFGAQNDSP